MTNVFQLSFLIEKHPHIFPCASLTKYHRKDVKVASNIL